MRVLLIEDDLSAAKAIKSILKSERYVCDITNKGEEGLELSRIHDYDLIILDLVLPDIDGYDVLRRFRLAHIKLPILVLSGLSDVEDKVKGLGFGADDYLTKPFNKMELLARAHAVVRRCKGYSDSLIRTGHLIVNLQSRVVSINGVVLGLTNKEYAIVELLSLRKGQTLTKEVFLSHLYGGVDEPELKIIDVFVCKLRRKIAKVLGCEPYIKTVWGRGYVLREPMSLSTNLYSVNHESLSS